jgi:hypothetical protein
MAVKGVIGTKEVSDIQAFNWIGERLEKLSLKEEEDIAVKELLERLREDFIKFRKGYIMFDIIKADLTPKQSIKIIDNIEIK